MHIAVHKLGLIRLLTLALNMEIGSSLVLDELTRGKELVRKLVAGIDSTSSGDMCRSLTKEISSSLDKAISILAKSPRPPAKSRHREGFGQPVGDMGKRRKRMPASKVRLGWGPGMKGPVDDGYSWRKYGKKAILAAKHPRGYYRCTHGKLQGCPAMKQVQRSDDDDPLSFDITYWGTHTCQQKSPPQHLQYQSQGVLLSFQTGLKVETEGSESRSQELVPTTPVNTKKPEVPTFSTRSANSDSNNFSMSLCQTSSYGGLHLQAAESRFTELVSAAVNPVTNSSPLEMEFLLDCVNLDQDFAYDTLSFVG